MANYTMRSVQASAFLRVMITLKTLNRNRRVASLVGRGERIGDGQLAWRESCRGAIGVVSSPARRHGIRLAGSTRPSPQGAGGDRRRAGTDLARRLSGRGNPHRAVGRSTSVARGFRLVLLRPVPVLQRLLRHRAVRVLRVPAAVRSTCLRKSMLASCHDHGHSHCKAPNKRSGYSKACLP